MAVAAAHGTADRADVDEQLMRVAAPSPNASPRNRRTETPAMPRLVGGAGVVASYARIPAVPSNHATSGAGPPAAQAKSDRPNSAAAIANRPRGSAFDRGASGSRQPPSESPIDGTVPSGMADGQDELEHPLQPLRHQRRHVDAVAGREHQEMQVDVRRVPLEARGLLEVHAVRVHLAFAFGDEHTRGHVTPSARVGEFRKQRGHVEQRQRVDGDARGRRGPPRRRRAEARGPAGRSRPRSRSDGPAFSAGDSRRSTSAQHHEITRNPSSEAAVAARSRSIRGSAIHASIATRHASASRSSPVSV